MRLRLLDALFYRADPCGCVEDLLVEFPAIVPNELDLAFELCLLFQGLALLGTQRFKLAVTLLEAVEADRRPGRVLVLEGRRKTQRRLRLREGRHDTDPKHDQ